MGHLTELPVFLAFVAALLSWQLRADADSRLSSHLRTVILPAEWNYVQEQLAKLCPDSLLSLDSPIRSFVTKSFYENCIGGLEDRKSPSLFSYATTFDIFLRERLSKKWLSLNMTDEEIALTEREPQNILFKPLHLIDFSSYGYDSEYRYKFLEAAGIFLIRDFLNAFKQELTLPKWRRFSRLENIGEKSIRNMKAIIDEQLGNGRKPIKDSSRGVKEWLESTKSKHPNNRGIRLACELLLRHLESETE